MSCLDDIRTPAFLVNLSVFKANAQRMIDKANSNNINLRPHIKTHKTLQGAKYQLGLSFDKIVCSTLGEARFFANGGFKDILYAVPISPDKLPEIIDLSQKVKIHMFIDNWHAYESVANFANTHNSHFSVFIKFDCGYGRAGVNINSEDSIKLAEALATNPNITLEGIYCHAGHAYSSTSLEDVNSYALDELKAAKHFKDQLEKRGIHPKVVSVGSTPTCSASIDRESFTEIHPGNYVFYDVQQVACGSASWEDCAGTVLTRVISLYQDRGSFLIDAGALALSKDTCPKFPGYGRIVGHPDLIIKSISQEVGVVISSTNSISIERFPIGTLLKVIPNHSCLSAACFERLYVIDDLDHVVDQWETCRGW